MRFVLKKNWQANGHFFDTSNVHHKKILFIIVCRISVAKKMNYFTIKRIHVEVVTLYVFPKTIVINYSVFSVILGAQ